jgi:hypothetical protein
MFVGTLESSRPTSYSLSVSDEEPSFHLSFFHTTTSHDLTLHKDMSSYSFMEQL